MKKYAYLLSMLSIASQSIDALQGPISTYAPPFYQSNPVSQMTSDQQNHVRRAFANIKVAFETVHARCQSRKDCLKQDLAVLQNFFIDHPEHPANPALHELNKAILHDSARHIFTTQWVIFQKLSQARQKEYRQGIRVFPIKKQMVWVPQGEQQATYNQDDILTRLLEELAHHHNNCQGYTGCLTRDLNIIANMQNRLAYNDPVRNTLKSLQDNIRNLASREIFNTILYLNLYNPLRPNWYEALQKHQSAKSLGYGRKEWQDIKRGTRPRRWISARITNGQRVGQTQYQSQRQYQSSQTQSQSQSQPQSQNQGKKVLSQIWDKVGQKLFN
jgi:hypothetical protein